jgi:rod shape-determining protein MreD
MATITHGRDLTRDIMPQGRQTFIVAVFIVVAVALQGSVAHAMMIRGAQPDLPLIALACGAALVGGDASVGLGFWTGLLQASVLGMYPGSYLASRTLAGAFAGFLERTLIRDSFLAPPAIVITTTLIAEVIFAAMAPPVWTHHVRVWSRAMIGEAVYNAALAFPLYFLLRKIGVGWRPADEYGDGA